MKRPIDIAPDDFIAYRDEIMLVSTEENALGRLVTFQITDDVEFCPFTQAFNRNRGGGVRYFAGFIELDEDEEPINQRKRKIVERNKEPIPIKNIVRDAGIRCRSLQFHRWVKIRLQAMTPEERRAFVKKTKIPYDIVNQGLEAMSNPKIATEWAKFYIYFVCNIKSRRELGERKGAAAKYSQGIMIPYDRWVN